MNVQMVNATFEDRQRPHFDPEGNADEFIARLPDYAAQGANAFTLNLQGGMPGYAASHTRSFAVPRGRPASSDSSRTAPRTCWSPPAATAMARSIRKWLRRAISSPRTGTGRRWPTSPRAWRSCGASGSPSSAMRTIKSAKRPQPCRLARLAIALQAARHELHVERRRARERAAENRRPRRTAGLSRPTAGWVASDSLRAQFRPARLVPSRRPYACRQRAVCPCLGQSRDYVRGRTDLSESVYGCPGVGGPDGARIPAALLRLLGWRRDLPRACAGDGARPVDLAERVRAGRPRLSGSAWFLHRPRVD